MNDTQLSFFLAVYDCGGYSAAANALFTSRQALGRAVTELEKELGGKLFARKGRGIEPTELGDKAARLTRSILADTQKLKALTNTKTPETPQLESFTVAVAAHGGRGIAFPPQTLLTFLQRELENYSATVEALPCEACQHALEAGVVDAALLMGDSQEPPSGGTLVGTRASYLAIGNDNPLARKKSLSIDDLHNVDLAQPESLTYMLPRVNQLCQERGFKPRWIYAGSNLKSLRQFIDNGGAVLASKSSPFATDSNNVKLVPFDAASSMELSFYCLRSERALGIMGDETLAKLKDFFY